MKYAKKFLALLLVFGLICAVPVLATEPETALLPIYVGVRNLEAIPESWNPLEETDAAQKAILRLTGEPLYRVNETGTVVPSQAAALPVDVTAEFAGTYGIPRTAARGYAFELEVRGNARWEDGEAVRTADWHFTLERLLEAGRLPLEIANYEAYLRGDTKPSNQIISLKEAGFASPMEAEADGHSDFYIDVTHFWGLDAGWLRITDRTPLADEAIPSGCEEMYLTAEYLYRTYLSEDGSHTMFQSEFVGIPVSEGEKLTMEDVGLLLREDRLVLILQEPATVSWVAAVLADVIPVKAGAYGERYGTAEHYLSCGPYRITSVSGSEITLEPNPHWIGMPMEFKIVCCRADG